jgi:hypothetical protein
MLDNENGQVLSLVQAMLGAISPNFRTVTIEVGAKTVLHYLLERDDATDREEIEDIEFEFAALQTEPLEMDVSSVVVVSCEPYTSVRLPGRMVYMRRE